jgi:serine/threonine protein kinase
VCLVDFGFSFRVDAPPSFSRMGTIPYVAPEMLTGDPRRYAPALDVWAAGATLLTAFTRKSLFCFRGSNVDASMSAIVAFDKQKLDLATALCPPALAHLIARLMSPVASRISAAEALDSEWLMLTPIGRSQAVATLYRMWRQPLGTLDKTACVEATL